jgi:hypothetical protein
MEELTQSDSVALREKIHQMQQVTQQHDAFDVESWMRLDLSNFC